MPSLPHHRVCGWCCGWWWWWWWWWWCVPGQPGQDGQGGRGVHLPRSPGPGTWPGSDGASLHFSAVFRHPRCHRPGLHVCIPRRVGGRCGEVCGGAIVDRQTSPCATPCRQERTKPSPPRRWGTRGAVMPIASAGSSACVLRHPSTSSIILHHPPSSSFILHHPASSSILYYPSHCTILHPPHDHSYAILSM